MGGEPTGRGWGAATGAALRRAGQRIALTPGLMRLLSVVLVVGIVAVALLSGATLRARREAADDVGLTAFPLLEATSKLYVALADADTTASRGFLEAGLVPVTVVQRYDDDLAHAAALLAQIARQAERSPAMVAAVAEITAALPTYAGYVATARADDRQNLVVGAAYLRKASDLMRGDVLPGARTLYTEAASQLDRDHGAGTDPRHVAGLVAGGVVLLLAAAGAQVFVAVRSRRTLNLGLLGASLALVVLVASAASLLVVQQQHLEQARREGSDLVKLLGASRILVLRAQSDANLALIERGTGQEYLDDYKDLRDRLGTVDPPAGLLGEAARARGDAGVAGDLSAVHRAYERLLAVTSEVRRLDDQNLYVESVGLALGDAVAAAAGADAALATEITSAGDRFSSWAAAARRGFGPATIWTVVLATVAVALVLAGFEPRIREYR